jgi:hypothetical protein
MSDKRPVLFIHPMNDSLNKLKEVLSESAEQDGVEIHEVKNIQELSQVLVQVGPSLAIYGHPKACAMGLQNNKKIIKRLQSKTIMLISQQIPRKTLDKFMKIGLTDCIVEPITPKTLLYKIKLLIRSLPTLSNEEDDYKKFTSEGEAENRDELAVKKGQTKNADESESPDAKNKDNKDNVINDQLKGKRTGQEEAIDGQMRGKNSGLEEIDTHYEGDVADQNVAAEEPLMGDIDVGADIVEKYYKGEQSGEYNNVKQDDLTGETNVDQLNETEISKLRENIQLELDDDGPEEKAKTPKTPIETLKKPARTKLELENEPAALKAPKELKKNAPEQKPSRTKLDIENEDSEEAEKAAPLKKPAPAAAKKKSSLELEQDEDLELKEKFQEENNQITHDSAGELLDVEDDSEETDSETGKVDHLEKYYKNKEKNEELDLEDTEEVAPAEKLKNRTPNDAQPRLKKTKLEIEAENGDYQRQHKEKLKAKRDAKENTKTKLEVDDELELKEVDKSEERPAARKLKKHATNLDIEEEQTTEDNEVPPVAPLKKPLKAKTKLDIEEESEAANQAMLAKAKLEDDEDGNSLEIEDDGSIKKRKAVAADQKDLLRGKNTGSGLNPESDEDDASGPMSKVDQIQKYYGFKSKKLEETDAEKTKSAKREVINHDQKKELYNKELIIDEVDLGEQTIDYGQIKKQFEELEGEYADKVKLQYQITEDAKTAAKALPKFGHAGDPAAKVLNTISGGSNSIDSTPPVLGDSEDGQIDAHAIEKSAKEEVVFHPDAKGLDLMVKVLGLYLLKTEDTKLFEFLTTKLYKTHQGVATFFMFSSKENQLKERFCGHQLLPNGLPKDSQGQPVDWKIYVQSNQQAWREMRVPNWSDETFQAKPIRFLNPFYEGNTFLGLVLVDFPQGIASEHAKKIEIWIESARAVYLENLSHQGGLRANSENKKTNENSGEKKGLLSRFFGKKESA